MNDSPPTEQELTESAIRTYRKVREYYINVDLRDVDVKELRNTIQYLLNSASLLLQKLKML